MDIDKEEWTHKKVKSVDIILCDVSMRVLPLSLLRFDPFSTACQRLGITNSFKGGHSNFGMHFLAFTTKQTILLESHQGTLGYLKTTSENLL